MYRIEVKKSDNDDIAYAAIEADGGIRIANMQRRILMDFWVFVRVIHAGPSRTWQNERDSPLLCVDDEVHTSSSMSWNLISLRRWFSLDMGVVWLSDERRPLSILLPVKAVMSICTLLLRSPARLWLEDVNPSECAGAAWFFRFANPTRIMTM